jgi:alpha-glucosidase
MDNSNQWWKDGVIYQIYPCSFADSNGDGVGDLQGIITHLDYLEELGVDAIWLSPVYPSPMVDFGYDVSDYCGIDPLFGSLDDFDILIREAHSRKIRVIMDLVLNHSSDQHPWFLESRSSSDNPYSDWYIWRDGKPGGKRPNNWSSWFGGWAWEYDEGRGQYYYHMFGKLQPELNWRNPQLREAMMEIFRFWMDRCVDGFRLDVFNQYFKDARFRDNPQKLGLRKFDRQTHIYDTDQPEMKGAVEEIRQVTDAYPERYVVGESFLVGPEGAAKYMGDGKLHAAFNFELLNCPWDAGRMQAALQRWENALGEDAWPTLVLNNHDNKRSSSRYRTGENDDRNKAAAVLLLTARGTPYLYYGEEIGMRNIHVPYSQIQDPPGKRYFPLFPTRDACRSPMQWDNSPQSGFSSSAPWMTVHPDFPYRNAAAQRDDPESLYNVYRKLIALRKEHKALQEGLYMPLTFEPKTLMAYLRQTKDEMILVAINFGRKPVRLFLGSDLAGKTWNLLLSTRREKLEQPQGNAIRLLGNEALVVDLD